MADGQAIPVTVDPTLIAREFFHLFMEVERGAQCRYFVTTEGSGDLQNFDAYVVCPETSVYCFKFVKLHIELPKRFPNVPPRVRFIHRTRHHIHPNFFVSGKLCLSFLGADGDTWENHRQRWQDRMLCHNMLLAIRNLLDHNPFKHEPWGDDNPELSHYVQYVTWEGLLLNYLADEQDRDFRHCLESYLRERGGWMLDELYRQRDANSQRMHFINPNNEQISIDYQNLIDQLKVAIGRAQIPPEQMRDYEEIEQAIIAARRDILRHVSRVV